MALDYKRLHYSSAFICIAIIAGLIYSPASRATINDWVANSLHGFNVGVSGKYSSYNNTCQSEEIGMYGQVFDGCVTPGSHLKFATLDASQDSKAVSFGKDRGMYALTMKYGSNLDYYMKLLPDTDTVMIAERHSQTINIVTNFSKKIRKVRENGFTYYIYDNSTEPSYTKSMKNIIHGQVFFSENSKHMTYVGLNTQRSKYEFYHVNLETKTERKVGIPLSQWLYDWELYKGLAISNDGSYLAASIPIPNSYNQLSKDDYHIGLKIWNLNDCRDPSTENDNTLSGDMCQYKIVDSELSTLPERDKIGKVLGINFSSDNRYISIYNAKESNGVYLENQLIIYPADDNSTSSIDYIAMGDSFSSGEGDLGGDGKYYQAGTNIVKTLANRVSIKNDCHVSVRSYPYLLAKYYKDIDEAHNIACSGALVRDDYTGNNDGYKGQGARLNVALPEQSIEDIKNEGLNDFTPGYNKQIEFVKKYQPKVITLTGGGNDAGFAKVLVKCAAETQTCDYVSDHNKRKQLGLTIASQFETLRDLYLKLHEASPFTKIYVIGYPQFFTKRDDPCNPNVRLNKEERTLTREGVSYMNQVISAAARTAGVAYINIENSFGNHILCGDDPLYVLGLTATWKKDDLWTDQWWAKDSFHPNPRGHIAMADSFISSLGGVSPKAYTVCPDGLYICPPQSVALPLLPQYFDVSNDNHYNATTLVQRGVVQKYKHTTVNATGLAPNSTVLVSMASTPTHIGNYETDSAGNLNVNIAVPSHIDAGYHTLYVDGESYSGEPMKLWQVVSVIGRLGDLDDNGTPDDQQECMLVEASYTDTDQDDIDDACDSIISSVPETPNPSPQHRQNMPAEQPWHISQADLKTINISDKLADIAIPVKHTSAEGGLNTTDNGHTQSSTLDTSKSSVVKDKAMFKNNMPLSQVNNPLVYIVSTLVVIFIATLAIIIRRKG